MREDTGISGVNCYGDCHETSKLKQRGKNGIRFVIIECRVSIKLDEEKKGFAFVSVLKKEILESLNTASKLCKQSHGKSLALLKL